MNKRIAIFDSGIGGLSLLKYLLSKYPKLYFIYFADQKNFPYGQKTNSFISKRMKEITQFLDEKDPLAIVLACNTATSETIKSLRKITKTPIVGIEPVIKPLSSYKNPLLLATTLTNQSARTKALINKYINKHITKSSPKNLVKSIENLNHKTTQKIIEKLSEKHSEKDAIGLSCTHYLLVKDLFEENFPNSEIIDPTQAVAKRIEEVVKLKNLKNPPRDWYTTGSVIKLKKQIKTYLGISANPELAEI